MNNSSVVLAGASPVQEITVVNFLDEDIRVLGTPQDPLFIASDIARWIEHSDVSMMCRMLDKADTKKVCIQVEQSNWRHKSESTQEVLAVTEQGLYKILWRSNKPKVDMYNDLMRSEGLVTVAELAKMMDMGSKTLYATLRSIGMLTLKNLPYQAMINKGYFKTKEEPYTDAAGTSRINVKVFVTSKGQKAIHDYVRSVSTAAELFK